MGLPLIERGQHVSCGSAIGVGEHIKRIPVIPMPCLLLDHQGQRDAFLDLILGESLQTGKADGIAKHPVRRGALGDGVHDARRNRQNVRIGQAGLYETTQIRPRHPVRLFQPGLHRWIKQALVRRDGGGA